MNIIFDISTHEQIIEWIPFHFQFLVFARGELSKPFPNRASLSDGDMLSSCKRRGFKNPNTHIENHSMLISSHSVLSEIAS